MVVAYALSEALITADTFTSRPPATADFRKSASELISVYVPSSFFLYRSPGSTTLNLRLRRSSYVNTICSSSGASPPASMVETISLSSFESLSPRVYSVKSLISLFLSTTSTTSFLFSGQCPASTSYCCLSRVSLSSICVHMSIDDEP